MWFISWCNVTVAALAFITFRYSGSRSFNGVSTPGIRPSPIAIPTNVERTLLVTDHMCSWSPAVNPCR